MVCDCGTPWTFLLPFFRAMMTKAYPHIGMSDTFNQLTIHRLLQGLQDQSIAYEVLLRKPRTLSEAVDMITWLECCKETTRKKSGIRQLSTFGNEGHASEKSRSSHTGGEMHKWKNICHGGTINPIWKRT